MPIKIIKHIYIPIILLFASILPILGQNSASVKIKTVVIDAGHGGKDPGAVSKDGRLQEKHLTLSMALELGGMITENYPDVKVIYTRTTDVLIPLHERSNIANKNNADLFISIHVNSTKSSSAYGTETLVMGPDKTNSNLEVCMKENSVVILEDDYTSKYEGYDPNNPESFIIFSLLQNAHLEQSLVFAGLVQDKMTKIGPIKQNRGIKQGPILVLWRCTMPAVLVEVGFISNSKEAKILADKESRNKICNSLFTAFGEYKRQFEKEPMASNESKPTQPQNTKQEVVKQETVKQETVKQETLKQESSTQKTERSKPAVAAPQKSESYFAIQVLAVTKILKSNSPELKGVKCEYRKIDNFYKYSTGKYSTREEAINALPEIKKLFPQAFIVKIEK